MQSPSLDLQKTHFRSIFRSFWKAICPLLPWHLWMLSMAVFIDIGWWALWILMRSSTPLHLAPRNSLTFAHCEAALFMYAWDFPFKSQSVHSVPGAIVLSGTRGETHKQEQGQGYHGDRREDHVLPNWAWQRKPTHAFLTLSQHITASPCVLTSNFCRSSRLTLSTSGMGTL